MTRCFTAPATLGKLDEFLTVHTNATVVELGSYEGGSAVHLLQNHPAIRLYCIDTWEPVAWDKTPSRNVLEAFLQAVEPYGRCTAIREDTVLGMAKLWVMRPDVDLVYVDADHHPEAVYKDVDTALKLWPETHLIGDDAETPGLLDAVRDAASRHGRMVEAKGPVWWSTWKRNT